MKYMILFLNWHLLVNYLLSHVIYIQCCRIVFTFELEPKNCCWLPHVFPMVSLKSLNESLCLKFPKFNRLIKETEYSEFWWMVVHVAVFNTSCYCYWNFRRDKCTAELSGCVEVLRTTCHRPVQVLAGDVTWVT